MIRNRLVCLLLTALLLGGCAATDAAQPVQMASLPSLTDPYSAPLGDAGLAYDALTALYLPSNDGQQLLAFYDMLPLTYSQHPAEAIVRALLSHPGNSRVSSLGGNVTLALTGSDPIEVTGSICTVNLSASALQLNRQDFYTLCMALSATLCELDSIHHVNVLVAGRSIAMDVAGYLPLGALTAHPGQELPVLWEQFSAKRMPAGEKPTSAPITMMAALYFPLADGSGIVPEIRRLSFPGQHPQQLAIALIHALSQGSEENSGAAVMPDLSALLIEQPLISDLNSGGKQITLHFPADIRSWMTASGADPACCFAALVTTLTTFIPSVEQVCILAGDTALTSLRNEMHGGLYFDRGLHTRQDYAGYLRTQVPVYHADGEHLCIHYASLPYRSIRSPRELLLTLARAQGSCAVLADSLSDADILGLSVRDDTLLINLSERYADAIRHSSVDQRRMAYAIVNTMCSSLRVRRVRFYFGGKAVSSLGSNVLWSGEFLYNPGIIRR